MQTKTVSTHDLKSGDTIIHYGAILQLRERHERNNVVWFYSDCLNLDEAAKNGFPRHWLTGENGYQVQGNELAKWALITR